MDGILNINKPPGITSFRVVAMVRRWSGEKRVGHAGTLDPIASGVLPVHLGQATRVVEYLSAATKTYRAGIEFGATTDSYDAEGKVLTRADASNLTREQLEEALAPFRGEIMQVPPAFSALKQDGKALYRLARAGVAVSPKARKVRIDRLEIMAWEPPVATIEVDCGKGTYIRSLAHDLGRLVGCGAFLKSLVRLRCGPFPINGAVSVENLEDAFRRREAAHLLQPIDSVLGWMPRIDVNDEIAALVRNGTAIALEDNYLQQPRRVYAGGSLLAILAYDALEKVWRPHKVFRPLDTSSTACY